MPFEPFRYLFSFRLYTLGSSAFGEYFLSPVQKIRKIDQNLTMPDDSECREMDFGPMNFGQIFGKFEFFFFLSSTHTDKE